VQEISPPKGDRDGNINPNSFQQPNILPRLFLVLGPDNDNSNLLCRAV
jgi:hypothetical protein